MTKKQLKERAANIIENGTLRNESGENEWKHFWYEVNGFLNCVTYKNGKLEEVNCYGKIIK